MFIKILESILIGISIYFFLRSGKQDGSPFSKNPLFVNHLNSIAAGAPGPLAAGAPPRKESLGKNDRKLSFGGVSKT